MNNIPSPYSPLQSNAELELDEKKKAVIQIIRYNLSRLGELAYGYYEDDENTIMYPYKKLEVIVESAESEDTLKTIVDGHISHYTEQVGKLTELKGNLSSSDMESKLRNETNRKYLDGKIEYINGIILPKLKAVKFPEAKKNGGRKKSSRKKRKRHKSKKISRKSKLKKK